MAKPIGIQLYTVRDALAQGFNDVVRKIAAIGYKGVETAGFPGTTPQAAADLFKSLGLEVSSAHSPLPLDDKRDEVLNIMKILGCKYLVCPWIAPDEYKTVESTLAVCKRLNDANKVAQGAGLKLVYHNHWFEYERIAGTNTYPYKVMVENLDPVLQPYLEDTYLNTRTPIGTNGTTNFDFTVGATGSNAATRFRIVFAPTEALPITFTSIKAFLQDQNIDVQWRTENEVNVKNYIVEKSVDGSNFSSIATTPATGNNAASAVYVVADTKPAEGYNYYRVTSVDINGKTSTTNVVKVFVGAVAHNIIISPNPITDGMIHLQLLNQPAGKYNIRLMNNLGQIIVEKQITHAGGNATELIKWNYNLAHGMYKLEVIQPDGSIKLINVMY